MIQFRSVTRALVAGASVAYALSFGASVQAATVLVEFEGVLLAQDVGGSGSALDAGSTIVGVLTYDTDTLPQSSTSTTRWIYNNIYEPFSSFSVYGADGTLLTQGSSTPGLVGGQTTVTFGAADGVDIFNINASIIAGDEFVVPTGGQSATPYTLTFRLSDATGTAFDSGVLPTELDLDSFDSARTSFRYRVGDAYTTQTFTLTSLQVVSPVPEPQTYALMAAGLGLVGAAVRRRARKQA